MNQKQLAVTMYAAAREYYGQGFRTDMKYWEHIAKVVIDNYEVQE